MSIDYGNYNDYYNLALYLNTVDCNSDYMSFQDGVLLNGAIGSGIEFAKYGGQKISNIFSKNKASPFTQLKQQLEMRNAVRGNNTYETLRNSWRWNELQEYARKMPKSSALSSTEFANLKPKQQLKVQMQGREARYYKKARRLLQEAKNLKGAEQAKKIKEFKQAFADARLAAYKAKFTGNLRPVTLIGKSKNALKTVTGVRALNTGLKTLNSVSPALRTAGRFVKVNGAFAVLSVAADYDKFDAAYKVGGGKAMRKEIAKSTGVAAAEAVGFFAGMKAGAAIGTAVGSVCPGVGNIVGGIAGAIIGGFASWGAGKLAHNALGCNKSEAEKITTKNARLEALRAKYNQSARKDLVRSAAEVLNEDTKIIQENLNDPNAPEISPVVQERYDNAIKSLNNIMDDDPELFEKLEQELSMAEQESSGIEQDFAASEQGLGMAELEPEYAKTDGNVEESRLPTSNSPPVSDQLVRQKALKATMNKFVERINSCTTVQNYSFQSPWELGNCW